MFKAALQFASVTVGLLKFDHYGSATIMFLLCFFVFIFFALNLWVTYHVEPIGLQGMKLGKVDSMKRRRSAVSLTQIGRGFRAGGVHNKHSAHSWHASTSVLLQVDRRKIL
jgi:hypothetical protein